MTLPRRSTSMVGTLKFAILLGALAAFVTCGAVAGILLYFRSGLPSPQALESIVPPVKTTIFDRSGATISELYQENRVPILLKDLPPTLVEAFVVTEDIRFHEHWGVSLLDNARALWVNLREGRKAQGGSTITQQLARNLFLTHEKVLTRKIKEALLAIEIERRYTKDEILEMYLNQIYFGHGAYGVESAARLYFAKSARDLTLAECALLAGIPKNPGGYSPIRHPDAAMARARVVLDLMERAGVITRREADEALEGFTPNTQAGRRVREAPYFIEYIRQQLLERYTPDQLYGGGLRIHTTLDLALQHAAEEALETDLAELEKKSGAARRRAAEQAAEEGPERKGEGPQTRYLQGALVAIDPGTGEIRALIGGRDFEDSPFNRAVQASRQPGSAFKVFVYTTAIEAGMTPSDVCLDTPMVLPVPGSEDYRPQNNDGKFRGPVLVRDALGKSINVPAVRVLLRVGAQNVVRTARRMGVTSDLRAVPSLALGSSEVTLLEMTSAFSIFPNQGVRAEPSAILRIEDRDGNILEQTRPRLTEVLDRKTAYVMTSMLESVVNEGTAVRVRAKGLKGAVAGKTGTPNDYTDGWFIGFTPRIVMGVWVGFDRKEKIGEHLTGSRTALPIWVDAMLAAGYGGDDPFPAPDGIVSREICVDSGLLAGESCARRRREIFIEGSEPSLLCTGRHDEREEFLEEEEADWD